MPAVWPNLLSLWLNIPKTALSTVYDRPGVNSTSLWSNASELVRRDNKAINININILVKIFAIWVRPRGQHKWPS